MCLVAWPAFSKYIIIFSHIPFFFKGCSTPTGRTTAIMERNTVSSAICTQSRIGISKVKRNNILFYIYICCVYCKT